MRLYTTSHRDLTQANLQTESNAIIRKSTTKHKSMRLTPPCNACIANGQCKKLKMKLYLNYNFDGANMCVLIDKNH